MNVGAAARDAGVPTLTRSWTGHGTAVRAEHGPADLVVANNVYAHIPDVVGFTRGLRAWSRTTAGSPSRCSTC